MNFFIIGGTEKAGTTSLYEYFTNHPQINTSINKETDFFREDSCDLNNYLKCFNKPLNDQQTFMEGSPGYLGLSDSVAPNIKSIAPQAKLVFMVRDPINRLRSSYLFHRSKLYIPENIDINEYVKYCIDYELGHITLEETPFTNPWFLNVLQAGAYQRHLETYLKLFEKNVKIINFDFFCKNTKEVMIDVCDFLAVDSNYFTNYEYFTANKTFQSNNHFIHKISMFANNKLEPILRKRPNLKRNIVKLYQKFNSVEKIDGGDFNKESLALLHDFYANDADWLKKYFENTPQEIIWKNFNG
jgi:hypothetical protein